MVKTKDNPWFKHYNEQTVPWRIQVYFVKQMAPGMYVPGRRLQICRIHENIHCLASQSHVHITSEYKRFQHSSNLMLILNAGTISMEPQTKMLEQLQILGNSISHEIAISIPIVLPLADWSNTTLIYFIFLWKAFNTSVDTIRSFFSLFFFSLNL